jgi:hypothetical protein
MSTRSATALFLLCGTLLLAGCKDATSPQASLVGTWDLTHIDGQTLPLSETWSEGDFSCTMTFVSAFVTFTATTYNFSMNASLACTDSATQNFTETSSGTWRTEGTTLYMRESGSNSEDPSTFSISGSVLTVTFSDDGDTTVLRFQRR